MNPYTEDIYAPPLNVSQAIDVPGRHHWVLTGKELTSLVCSKCGKNGGSIACAPSTFMYLEDCTEEAA